MRNTIKTSRRKFIKSTSAAAAAFTVVPRHVLGGAGFVAPSDRLVIAGIGVGGQGNSDLRVIHETGKAEVAYLCDVNDRRAAGSVERFPKAKYYRDFREMLDKEHRHIDAVCVATPDHNHAIQALAAMQLGKHVYVEKPLAHDVWEARVLTDAAKRYRVVTQMGNQGTSNDGPRLVREWYEAGVIGDVHTVYAWTDRPIWPTAISLPSQKAKVPTELDWDLWLGTAQYRDYPAEERGVWYNGYFNWRLWWDYSTGALGDIGCHLLDIPFSVLGLQHVQEVQASVGRLFVDQWILADYPDVPPPSSYVTMRFPKTARTQGPVTLHWMDGGIQPPRPEELGPDESFGTSGNGTLLVGTKGKILTGIYGEQPRLLPTSRQVHVPQKYPRVEGSHRGAWGGAHLNQWVDACIAGYGNKEVSSPFEIAGPLTEAILVANLAVRGADMTSEGRYPSLDVRKLGGLAPSTGRNVKMQWDHETMRMTNFDVVNQFVKREYRPGWEVKYKL